LRAGGATVGINDGCISADEFPAFMDLIDKLAPQAGMGDEHGIFYVRTRPGRLSGLSVP
jgi:hypothetical protein